VPSYCLSRQSLERQRSDARVWVKYGMLGGAWEPQDDSNVASLEWIEAGGLGALFGAWERYVDCASGVYEA
jgi:hypothetical protein